MKDIFEMNESEFKEWVNTGSVDLRFKLTEDVKYKFDLYR